LATLAVNVFGCLIVGILGGLAQHHSMPSQAARLFLMTGLLGGFTTFSAFGLETLLLMRGERVDLALLNALLSVVVSLVAVWLGFRLVELF